MNITKLLNDELTQRKQRNSRYSIRSFARSLGIDSTALSRILKGDRQPNLKTELKILKALNKHNAENITSLTFESKLRRNRDKNLLKDSFDKEVFDKLFSSAHIYILTALRLSHLNLEQIRDVLTKQCQINKKGFEEVTSALIAIGAIRKNENGQLDVLYKNKSTVPIPLTSEVRRNLQKEFLQTASTAIDKYSIDERDNSTLTVAINKKDLEKIRSILRDAHHKINRISEKNKNKDAIYNICFAAYPIVR